MTYREATLDTRATPDVVWRIWADVNTWPQWNPDMKESRLDGPLRVGATGMVNPRSGGKHDVRVTHLDAGRSFELESTAMPMTRMAIRATVTPSDGGSRMSQAF